MKYTTITTQEQYDRYKEELNDLKDTWQIGAVDAKMKINQIEKLCLAWRNAQEAKANKLRQNITTMPRGPYTIITTHQQYDEYKIIRSALMELKLITPAITAEIKLVDGLIKNWEINKKEPKIKSPKKEKFI